MIAVVFARREINFISGIFSNTHWRRIFMVACILIFLFFFCEASFYRVSYFIFIVCKFSQPYSWFYSLPCDTKLIVDIFPPN